MIIRKLEEKIIERVMKMESKNSTKRHTVSASLNDEQFMEITRRREETGQTTKAFILSALNDTPILNLEALKYAIEISEECYEPTANFLRKLMKEIGTILEAAENNRVDEVVQELKALMEDVISFDCKEEKEWLSLRLLISHHNMKAV